MISVMREHWYFFLYSVIKSQLHQVSFTLIYYLTLTQYQDSDSAAIWFTFSSIFFATTTLKFKKNEKKNSRLSKRSLLIKKKYIKILNCKLSFIVARFFI